MQPWQLWHGGELQLHDQWATVLVVMCLPLGPLNAAANLLVATLQVAYLVFAINAMQSLENEAVRAQVLKLVNLQLWHALSPGRLKVREQI